MTVVTFENEECPTSITILGLSDKRFEGNLMG